MNLQEVMKALESLGTEQTRKIYKNHGASEPLFGVKVGDMKSILKKTKKDHALALELFQTLNGDAMYLAGLMADEQIIDKATLKDWAQKANWYMISEYTVPWIAAESAFGLELALEWIESTAENIASCGWATLSSLCTIKADDLLDMALFEQLLNRAANEVHSAPNRVRYTMNGFIIAVGSCLIPLSDKALNLAAKMEKVEVNVGKTSCKVPSAKSYIEKVIQKNRLGKKKKQARC